MRRRKKYKYGITLTEVLITSTIALMVSGGVSFLFLFVNKMMCESYYRTQIQTEVNYAGEFITHNLRNGNASRDYTISFAEPVPEGDITKYRRIYFWTINAYEEKYRSFYFVPEDRAIYYQPDIKNDPDNIVCIARGIDECFFYIDPPDKKTEVELEIRGSHRFRGKVYEYFIYTSASLRAQYSITG